MYPWSLGGARDAALQGSGAGHTLHYVAIDQLGTWLDAAQSVGTRIVAQIDAAYITSTDVAQARVKAVQAAALVRPYAGHPALAAVSLREEPSPALMPALDAAYAEFRRQLPGVPLQLTHNQSAAASVAIASRPERLATDRYAFWGWDPSAGGYCATPMSALRWYWAEVQRWVALLGPGCTIAICGSRLAMWASESTVASGSLGTPDRIRALADAGNHGWARTGGGYRYWKYYEPPPGSILAMVWLAYLAGARGVLLWTGGSATTVSREMDAGLSRASWSGELIAPCSRRVLDEFAATARDIRAGVPAPSVESLLVAQGPSSLVNSFDRFVISSTGRVADDAPAPAPTPAPGPAVARVSGEIAIAASAPAVIVRPDIADWLVRDAPVAVPANFVGMHFNRTGGRPAYRYGHARTHDHDPLGNGTVGTQWRQIEPTRGDRYTETLRAFVATHGTPTIWTVGGTPTWAARDPDVMSTTWGALGAGSMPRSYADLAGVVRAALELGVQVIEVWNEPEPHPDYAGGWFNGSAVDLATLTRWLRDAVGSRARLVGPAYTDIGSGSGWKVTGYADALGADVLDAVSWHCYLYDANPARHALGVATQCRLMREQVDATALRDTPLWLTELGCDSVGWSALPADTQAACVGRWLLVAAALGMQRATLYAHELRYCGAPAANPAVADMIDRVHRLIAGQTITQAAILADGRVWARIGGEDPVI
ncbi:MAG: hypothetical protein IPH07_24595 [Deltaproteobacteria bacterium]|nr:hypothetical protein [Deltaproteobacteria bacterium]